MFGVKINKFFIVIIVIFLLASFRNIFAITITAKNAAILDYNSLEVLYQKDIKSKIVPSSLTKIMTSYVIFDLIKEGKVKLNDKFKVSIRAWRQEGSRMFLEPEWKIAVDELLNGLITQSGNDAAIVLAEGSLGSIEAFVQRMNQTAKKLGLQDSNFKNPTGLHENGHFMTTYDMAKLSYYLIKNHKKYYDIYFSKTSYKFNNINQRNRNWLLTEYENTDGIKTGYTDKGGYSIISSVENKKQRFIVVVSNAKTERSRIEDSKKLLNYAFENYSYLKLYGREEIVASAKVYFGMEPKVQLYVKEDIFYSTRKKKIKNIKVQILYNEVNIAPIKKDSVQGKILIIEGKKETYYNLYAMKNIEGIGRFKKFMVLYKLNCKKFFNKFLFWK